MTSQSSRNHRKMLAGVVSSISGTKSIKVTVPYKVPHPMFLKVINRKTVVHVHDESSVAKVGDRVVILETRPISRLKRWRLVEVTEEVTIAGTELTPEKDVRTGKA